MKTLLYANRAEPKSISVISILLLAAVGAITKLRCMHRECYIFASQNLCYAYRNIRYTYTIYGRYSKIGTDECLDKVTMLILSHIYIPIGAIYIGI